MNITEILTGTIRTVNELSKKRGYNRYIKRYPLEKMFILLLYQQYSGMKYGRSLTVHLGKMVGATAHTVSQSELSKKLSYRLPIEPFKDAYKLLLAQVQRQSGKRIRKLKQMVRIVDSTALSASSTMKYAKHRQNKNGFKMHTVIDGNYFPVSFKLKNGKSSDKKSLKWAVKEGFLYLFDRGYNDYRQFKWISDKHAFFVTRALGNIQYTTSKNKKVGYRQKEYGIISDKHIEVAEDRKQDTRLRLRMVTFGFVDSKNQYREFSLLTNLMDLRSDEIAKLYRERWNIEVLFRWLKTFLKMGHWLSRSINGVLIQIYTALCSYLMARLAKMGNQKIYRIMKDATYDFLREFTKAMSFPHYSNIEGILAGSS